VTTGRDPGFVARVGLAVVRPRWALSIAGDRRFAGRSGSDLIAVIGIVLLATQLRGLLGAIWMGVAVEASLGLRAAVHVLTRALTVDLAFLVLGALLLWAIAGAKRNLGRAFDLACVAAIPLLLVELAATVVVRGLDFEVPQAVGWMLSGLAWGWSGALIALATRPARVAPQKTASPPDVVVRAGRHAGWAVLGVAIAGLAIQTLWIVRQFETMRPVTTGEPAPALALPEIGPGGAPGPKVTLAASLGKVTVIDFWATWCGPCLKALPALDRIARKPDVTVLAINLDDAAAARALFDERGYAMTLLADDTVISERYGVTTIPHTIVLGRDGVVQLVGRGASIRDVEAAVDAALAPPVSASRTTP
jgi:thiol-disulfide isomerase/thioredoxin